MSYYRGMTCENVTLSGDKGTPITAYVARPSTPSPLPGVVLVHHLPASSTLKRLVGSRITAISRSAPTCMSARVETAIVTLTTSPPRCAPREELRTPRWSAIRKPR
jgi:hypothetical protein